MIRALENQFRVPKYLMRMIRSYLKDYFFLYGTIGGDKSRYYFGSVFVKCDVR